LHFGVESAKAKTIDVSAAIFAKACIGHPGPSKQQKLRDSHCLRLPLLGDSDV